MLETAYDKSSNEITQLVLALCKIIRTLYPKY